MENVFSERILQARREKGLSQRAAAALIGIQPASLSSYESGRKSPNLEIASKISTAYGRSLDWLCGTENNAKADTDTPAKQTKAGAFRTFTALCESGLPVEVHADWHTTNGRKARVIVCIEGCEWLAKLNDTYQKLIGLLRSGEIETEVLNAWKDKKMMELDEPINAVVVTDDELPF